MKRLLILSLLLLCSCQRIIDRAEEALECDEEIDVKFKIDFKDKDQADNDKLLHNEKN